MSNKLPYISSIVAAKHGEGQRHVIPPPRSLQNMGIQSNSPSPSSQDLRQGYIPDISAQVSK